jgi:hypothetical protein
MLNNFAGGGSDNGVHLQYWAQFVFRSGYKLSEVTGVAKGGEWRGRPGRQSPRGGKMGNKINMLGKKKIDFMY